jgi:DNA-binding beta-propeller fold protein YncE
MRPKCPLRDSPQRLSRGRGAALWKVRAAAAIVKRMRCSLLTAVPFVLAPLGAARPCTASDILVSANEGKYDLSSGRGRVVERPELDSLSLLDFAVFPPRVRHISGVANSVVGPPTNVAITPDGRLALVANSVRRYTEDPKQPVPDDLVQVVDLSSAAPKIIATLRVGRQPSGIAIRRAGDMALVANRADGMLSVLSIDGPNVAVRETISVGEPTSEPADVAINPSGTLALVSLNKAGVVRALRITGGHLDIEDRKLPVYGQPYHIDITPDGLLGLVAGGGNQNGPDADLLSVIDLTVEPKRTIDHLIVGTGPESFDVSPDGQLLAVVLMEGSNMPAGDPSRSEHGALRLWRRQGKSFGKLQDVKIGRIPEGVCFTPDGRYLVLQEHAAKRLVIYEVLPDRVKDTGLTIATPGFPSALRRAPAAP